MTSFLYPELSIQGWHHPPKAVLFDMNHRSRQCSTDLSQAKLVGTSSQLRCPLPKGSAYFHLNASANLPSGPTATSSDSFELSLCTTSSPSLGITRCSETLPLLQACFIRTSLCVCSMSSHLPMPSLLIWPASYMKYLFTSFCALTFSPFVVCRNSLGNLTMNPLLGTLQMTSPSLCGVDIKVVLLMWGREQSQKLMYAR